ncbi:polysaccharide deacetylase family protein [Paenibacillus senegalimassiliensis]|uniref:polysaccharide deacetylase family protein n=1 Tax=Paenibacillus senegalimassiliensis TaxID=1737426 RepID=UPI001E33D29A|nr:polysaccharide deacetylase family protein [Paenibacillus senegalimassiliensis]
MPSYISRREQHTNRSKRTHSAKFVVITAMALSLAAMTLTAAALIPVISGSNPNRHYRAEQVVPPGLAASEENLEEGTSVAKPEPVANPAPTPQNPVSVPEPVKLPPPAQQPPNTVVEQINKPDTPKVQKTIYLTFDDGPGKYTEPLLEIMERYQVHGTFFMIGNQLGGHQQAVKDAAEAGHYIGLHSMSHSKKKLYDSGNADHFIAEFTKEQEMVKALIGTSPALIRAPYGSKPEINQAFRDEIAEAGFKMWDWTVDSKDWKNAAKPELILQEIKRQVKGDTEVILLHEKAQTVAMLPQIIEYLQEKGYAFAVYKPEQHFSVNFDNDPRL